MRAVEYFKTIMLAMMQNLYAQKGMMSGSLIRHPVASFSALVEKLKRLI